MAPAPGVCGECSQGLAVSTRPYRARQRQGGVGERQRPAAWPTRYTVQIRGLCPACIYGSAAQIAAALRVPACIYAVYWGHGGSTFHALQPDRLLSCVLSRWIVGPEPDIDMPTCLMRLWPCQTWPGGRCAQSMPRDAQQKVFPCGWNLHMRHMRHMRYMAGRTVLCRRTARRASSVRSSLRRYPTRIDRYFIMTYLQ